MAGLRDVARLAGVSTTTVSHALNRSRHVHPETHGRILRAVEALDYRPNILARSLRRRTTRTIGLLVSDIEVSYFTEIARAVEATAYERGYNVVLCNTDESPEKEALYTTVLLGKQADGLIVAPSPGDHAHLRAHIARGARIVFINRQVAGIDAPAVICDDVEAMRTLTDRLIADGHRRIGALLGLPGISTTERRLRGFHLGLEAAGLRAVDAWTFPGEGRQEGGVRAAQALAASPDPPTAIVAFNTAMLDGLLLGLLDVAPDMLERLIVTGFGCSAVARVSRASPYTLAAPTRAIGRAAATLLLDGLAEGGAWHIETLALNAPLVELRTRRQIP